MYLENAPGPFFFLAHVFGTFLRGGGVVTALPLLLFVSPAGMLLCPRALLLLEAISVLLLKERCQLLLSNVKYMRSFKFPPQKKRTRARGTRYNSPPGTFRPEAFLNKKK